MSSLLSRCPPAPSGREDEARPACERLIHAFPRFRLWDNGHNFVWLRQLAAGRLVRAKNGAILNSGSIRMNMKSESCERVPAA